MKFLPLLWGNLWRKPARTGFTLLSVVIAFLLYGYLSAIAVAFGLGIEMSGADRLIMTHKTSLIQLLPERYLARILQTPGVTAATHATWFGGIYQEPKNFFPQMAVNPVEHLAMYPEFLLPPEQRSAWLQNRTGAIAGRQVAERFGWKIGDRIPLQGTIWRNASGASWEFVLEGIYDGKTPTTDTSQFLFHHAYLEQSRTVAKGLVGWYIIRINQPTAAATVSRDLDLQFANSSYETKTGTEKAFIQGFANQMGAIGTILQAILSAVFFTLLLVTGNTMAQAVRERIPELAVLKALGFDNRRVLWLVLQESLLLAILGGGIGLVLGWTLIQQGDPTGGMLPLFHYPPRDLAIGIGLALLLGIISGLLPAWRAMRLQIVDALRKG